MNRRAAKEVSPLEKSIAYGKSIAGDLERWNSYRNGTITSFDPFYEDGYNMNSIRRQIVITRKKIENELPIELYPKEYSLPVPEEMDNYFIACQDTWIEKGEKRLVEIKRMPSYIQLTSLGYQNVFTPKDDDKNHVYYYAVIGYVKNLERSIREAKTINSSPYPHCHNPYLDLRRYASYGDSWWVDAFTRCINAIFKRFPEQFKEPNEENYPIEAPHNKNLESDCVKNQGSSSIRTIQKPTSNKKESYKQYSLFDFGLC